MKRREIHGKRKCLVDGNGSRSRSSGMRIGINIGNSCYLTAARRHLFSFSDQRKITKENDKGEIILEKEKLWNGTDGLNHKH